jgi:hypothetical protein
MRRSTLAISLGILLTLAFVTFWALSCRGEGSVYILPQGIPSKAGDFLDALGVGIGKGSLTIFRSHTDRISSSISEFFGAGFVTFEDLRGWDEQSFPLPAWSELVMGRFASGVEGFSMGSSLTFPFWLPVLLFLFITFVTHRILRRREIGMNTQINLMKNAQQDAPSNGG